jgi:hypothetical protein
MWTKPETRLLYDGFDERFGEKQEVGQTEADSLAGFGYVTSFPVLSPHVSTYPNVKH